MESIREVLQMQLTMTETSIFIQYGTEYLRDIRDKTEKCRGMKTKTKCIKMLEVAQRLEDGIVRRVTKDFEGRIQQEASLGGKEEFCVEILKRISPMLMAEISQRVPDISDEDIEGHVCPMCDSGLVAELSAAKDWANVNVLSHVGEPESEPLTSKNEPPVSLSLIHI